MASRHLSNMLRYGARIIVLMIASFWFIFALLSGATEYGNGLWGIIQNSPNALPWMLLFALVYIAWRWELIGGLLITGMGIFTIFFFQSWRYLIVFFGVSGALIVLGLCFIGSWYLHRED